MVKSDPETTISGSLGRTIFFYLFWFFSFLCLVNFLIYQRRARPIPSLQMDIVEKAEFYRQNASKYDLVFVGDSRTYCAIHPDLMDRLIGSHSVNLAHFSHWFATQYPFFQDMVKSVPQGATLVWSVGHQNFHFGGSKIRARYPIGFKNLPRYLFWGYPLERLAENILYFSPLLQLWGKSKQFHNVLTAFSERVLIRSKQDAAPAKGSMEGDAERPLSLEDEKRRISERYSRSPGVSSVDVIAAGGKVNSAVLYRDGGSYYRVELDPSFFRAKQREDLQERMSSPQAKADDVFSEDPEYMKTFEAALALLKENRIRLVVNEIEEAPYVYFNPKYKSSVRNFMATRVRPLVEKFGFAYTRVDFDQFTDDEYFDYNHLNSRGSEKYDRLLAAQLVPWVGPAGGR